MIRLVMLLLFALIVWVMFFSKLSPIPRRTTAGFIFTLFVAAVWFDDYRKRPKDDVLPAQDVISCGIDSTALYRSNVELKLCFANTAERGTVRRIKFEVNASRCPGSADQQQCELIERVEREMPIVIGARSQTTTNQSLRFDKLSALDASVQWSVKVISVKAVF